MHVATANSVTSEVQHAVLVTYYRDCVLVLQLNTGDGGGGGGGSRVQVGVRIRGACCADRILLQDCGVCTNTSQVEEVWNDKTPRS